MAMRQITWSGHVFPGDMPMESFPGLATDGTRIYFDEVHDGRFVLAFSLSNDNETHLLTTNSEIAGPTLIGISSNGTKLMVRNHLAPEIEQPLWIMATSGSSVWRIPGVLAHDATWMPDGESISVCIRRRAMDRRRKRQHSKVCFPQRACILVALVAGR